MENECGESRSKRDAYGECQREYQEKKPEDIMIPSIDDRDSRSMNLKDYIVELFQQHERDRNPGRDFCNKKTGEVIDPLRGAMLDKLMPVVDIIANNIANGTISANALYKLVGENKVIEHKASGARVFVKEETLINTIENELAPVLGTRERVKMEEFMAKFANPALVQQTLKDNLASMKGVERALFASLFPDDILEQAGLKKKDINEVRKQAHKLSADFVAASVAHFSNKKPEELKKIGLTDDEIDAIHSMADHIEHGDVDALRLCVNGHNKDVVDAVRTAGMLEQIAAPNKGAGFWTERVKEMSKVRSSMQKKKAEMDEESKHAHDDEHGHENEYGEDGKKHHKKRRDRGDSRHDSWDDGGYDEDFHTRRKKSSRSSWRDKEAGDEDHEYGYSSRHKPSRGYRSAMEGGKRRSYSSSGPSDDNDFDFDSPGRY